MTEGNAVLTSTSDNVISTDLNTSKLTDLLVERRQRPIILLATLEKVHRPRDNIKNGISLGCAVKLFLLSSIWNVYFTDYW